MCSEEAQKKDAAIVAAGLDYYSTYLWRGTYYFNKDAAFCPTASIELPGAGLKFTYIGEIAQSYLFDGMKSQQKNYIIWNYYRTFSYTMVREGRKMNAGAYALHGADFQLDYTFSVPETISFNISALYVWTFNAARARETRKIDNTSITMGFTATIDAIKVLTPTLGIQYDYYTVWKRGGDFYPSIGLKQDFELTKENKATLGAQAGYYYQRTARSNWYYYYQEGGCWLKRRWPVKKGVSDVDLYANWEFSKGAVTYAASFHWVIVPSRTWHRDDDVHRPYAKLGVKFSY